MKHRPILLSAGAASCGCLLARMLIHTRASDAAILVIGEKKELPDPSEILRDLMKDIPRIEVPEVPMIDRKMTGFERRNLNRPFYSEIGKKGRRR